MSGAQVEGLFRNHNDLLSEFTYFLPDAQAVKDQQRRAATGGGGGASRGGRSGLPSSSRGHQQVSSPAVKHKRKTAQRAEEGFKAGCESAVE